MGIEGHGEPRDRHEEGGEAEETRAAASPGDDRLVPSSRSTRGLTNRKQREGRRRARRRPRAATIPETDDVRPDRARSRAIGSAPAARGRGKRAVAA